MRSANTCRARSRAHRGFTLVEVLMAAFIIALGVLGLLALFAGAAKQQQSSTQRTRSMFFSNSAASMLAPALGRLQFPNTGGNVPAATDGVWIPVMMDDRDFFLTLVGNTTCDKAPFFLSALPNDFHLFDAPTNPAAMVNQTGFVDLASRDAGPFVTMRSIPGRDLEPQSLEFRVEINRLSIQSPTPTRTVQLRHTPVQDGVPPDDSPPNLFVYEAAGGMFGLPGTTPDHVVVDVQPCTVPTIQRRDAEIIAMSITLNQGGITDEYISSVQLVKGMARRQELVSLNDRILERTDPSADSGKRPEMSYSLLTRARGSGTQVVVFTYALTPPSGTAKWIPPERPQDFSLSANLRWSNTSPGNPPLRQAELELGYDLSLKQYFVEANAGNADVQWALTQGQILLVQGREKLTNGLALSGSDQPVTVIRRQRSGANSNTIRAYLNRGPRSEGRAFLSGDDREQGIKKKLFFIGVSDTARSIDDQTEWALNAIDARVIQVTN